MLVLVKNEFDKSLRYAVISFFWPDGDILVGESLILENCHASH